MRPETKLDIALRGLRIDPGLRAALAATTPQAETLELLVGDHTQVSAPIDAAGTAVAPFDLRGTSERCWLSDPLRDGDAGIAVRLPSPPRFQGRQTSSGVPMQRLATLLGTVLLVHPGGACGFSVQGSPCRFCVEGARGRGQALGTVADVVEVVRAVFEEGVAELVALNTDAFDVEAGGLAFLAPYVEGIRRHFDTLVAVQVHPPRADRWIDWAYGNGVDAISFNLELFDPHLLDRHCVGRTRYIGRQRYLDAIGYAATVFPSGTVWSDLVLGLEPVESTLAGIDALAALGAVPVVATRRGLVSPPLDHAVLTRILARLHGAVRDSGISMSWVRELPTGITPLEADPASPAAGLGRALHGLARSRLGGLATRGLARFRRRLRVKTISDSFDASHL